MDNKKIGSKKLGKRTKWIIGIAIALFFIIGIYLLWPDQISRFIYDYYLLPIIYDTGYNPVNTLTWISLLVVALYLANRYLSKLIKYIDLKFFSIVSIYMIAAASLRVLEDAELFLPPLSYLFITPFIDLLIALTGIVSVLFALLLKRSGKKKRWFPFFFGGVAYLVLNIFYLFFYFSSTTSVRLIPSPLIFLGASLIPFLVCFAHYNYKKKVDPMVMSSIGGLVVVSFSFYFIGYWLVRGRWAEIGESSHLWIILAVIGLAGAITGVIYLLAYGSTKRWKNASFYLYPINLLVIFAQLMDATATSIGMDWFGYTEKHWIPSALIGLADKIGLAYPATLVMLPIKLGLVVLLVYFIDLLSKESETYANFGKLLKLVIFMLGLGPGIRDTLRIAMGI
jgi:uncharacterized membrane protein